MKYSPKSGFKPTSSDDPLVESRTVYYNPAPRTQAYKGPKNVLYDSNPSIKIDIPEVRHLESY